jgi:hypothetical protein
MHRQCELDLLAQIARGAAGFCVIGCGAGEEFLALKAVCPELPHCLGIDRLGDPGIPGVAYWNRDLLPTGQFDSKITAELEDWRESIDGPVFWYTDNGNKVEELAALALICKQGDVLGTHDFGTEVPLCVDTFLRVLGFQYIEQFDDAINANFHLQGFWVKVKA